MKMFGHLDLCSTKLMKNSNIKFELERHSKNRNIGLIISQILSVVKVLKILN